MSCRWIKATPQMVSRLLLGCEGYTSDLPSDIQCRDITFDAFHQYYKLLVESKQFEDVPEGSVFPEITPEFRYKNQ